MIWSLVSFSNVIHSIFSFLTSDFERKIDSSLEMALYSLANYPKEYSQNLISDSIEILICMIKGSNLRLPKPFMRFSTIEKIDVKDFRYRVAEISSCRIPKKDNL